MTAHNPSFRLCFACGSHVSEAIFLAVASSRQTAFQNCTQTVARDTCSIAEKNGGRVMQTKNLQNNARVTNMMCAQVKILLFLMYYSVCAGKKFSYSWEQVLKVLYQPAVGGNRVADELKKYRIT